ncbi:MAG: aminopeptidase [Candidatus Shapirobacteria bacterium]
MNYKPDQKILDNYADILINYALNNGQGIRAGEVVFLQVQEYAKPLLLALYRSVLKAKAQPIIQYIPDEFEKEFFSLADSSQLDFFPAHFLKGKVKQADHFLTIIAETNKHELEGINPQKIMQKNLSLKPYLDWRHKKESQGKFSWTLGLYPTPAMAAEAKMSLKSCWQQVIKACYLDDPTPLLRWQDIQESMNQLRHKLNKLPVDSFHLESKNTDLIVGIDKNRQWLGGDGCNIPSFEIFISPDWRLTQGHISFDLPLYRYGNEIRDIYLEFKDGVVIKSTASKGENILKEMIATKNADKIGEFSLTDKRFSKINKFMAETLYDENFGGRYGNTHIALGASFHESYSKNSAKITENQWSNMGFNDSVIHTDIIATTNRTVTANLINGTKKIIYKDGKFTL